jgi:Tfp pilus assembly protein PilX
MPFFVHRIFTYQPSKPRHPLLRLVLGLLGLVVLAVLVVVGLFVGLGMLLFAAFRRMLRSPVAAPAARQAEESVIEGEYSIVDKRPATLSLQ